MVSTVVRVGDTVCSTWAGTAPQEAAVRGSPQVPRPKQSGSPSGRHSQSIAHVSPQTPPRQPIGSIADPAYRHLMQWATIIATALGAVVGVLSSAASDRLHWRRDVSERDRESLRTAYAEFLDAVTQASNAIGHAVSGTTAACAVAAAQALQASASPHSRDSLILIDGIARIHDNDLATAAAHHVSPPPIPQLR